MRKLIFVLVLSFASTLAQAASTTMTRLNFRSTSELALWTVTAQQTNLTATVSDVGNYSFAPGSTATVDSPRVIASVGVAGRWILNQATDVELISSGGAPMALVTVPSITSLASHKPKPGQTNVYIMGYSSVGDGGQGRFSYSSSFPSWTTVTNEVCIAATGGGYWFREEVATGTLNAKWFGMSGTVTNDVNSGGALARMQVLANNNKWRIYFPKGDYYVETWVTYTNHANVHWQGDGMELSRILTTVGHDGSGGQIIYWKGVTNAVFEDLAFNGATNMIVATRARSAGIATIHMHRPMNMWPGTRVNITGMGDSTYNASQAVVLTMPNSSTFTYASAGANETEASDYSGQVMVTFAIWAGGGDWKDDTTAPATCTTDSRSSGVVTMNFSGAHGFTNGCSVTITGSSRGLNVTNAIMTVVDADTITYPLAGGDLGSAADASASADQEWS